MASRPWNGVDGALESTTNPNSFVGNTLAVDYVDSIIDARFSWWGDPSGPTSPSNPGGTGDPADLGVTVVPFLTSEPDFNDHPPIVRLLKGPRRENAGGATRHRHPGLDRRRTDLAVHRRRAAADSDELRLAAASERGAGPERLPLSGHRAESPDDSKRHPRRG